MAVLWTDTAQKRLPRRSAQPGVAGHGVPAPVHLHMVVALCGKGFGPGPARAGLHGLRP